MIELININKYYKAGSTSFHALTDINLKFADKGMNFILGKSGSGKSTLLNIIGGIDSYDSGELIIDGLSTKKFKNKDYHTYRNTYIGFIFQEFNVLKGLNVYDNIALSLELQHQNIKDKHDDIMAIIERVGLTGLEKRMMNQLSGGQRQRVAIARSLIKNPRVIIADEPTGNLDSKNSENIMNLLKDLSTDHLVIIVTHNERLAKIYSDRTIEIKDGQITSDDGNVNNEETNFDLQPISVPIKTSLHLSIKAIFKSIRRFIFMMLLFTVALVFAGVVINMSLANTTLTYAKYQSEYKNDTVGLVSQFTSYGYTSDSAFYDFLIDRFEKEYLTDTPQFKMLKTMHFPLSIDDNSVIEYEFYLNTIENIHLYDSSFIHKQAYLRTYSGVVDSSYIPIVITDYLAENLVFQNFFGNSVTKPTDVCGKTLHFDCFNSDLFVQKIIITNYSDYKDYFTYFNENAGNDTKAKCAFFDNAVLYNSILVDEAGYNRLFSSENIKYFYSDVVYNMVADQGVGHNLLVTTYPDDANFVTNKEGKEPQMHAEGEPVQVAVTTGFFEKILNVYADEASIDAENSKSDLLYKKIHYEIAVHDSLDSDVAKMQAIYASNFLCYTSYVPTNSTFNITQIIDNDDEAILYLASPNESPKDYDNTINSVFGSGAFITLIFDSKNYLKSDAILASNAKLYRKFINNNINLTNQSFTKILLVDQFINDNLPLFLGIFFVFALFSFLLIFNFVIINIKNSTRDIGIYMSLGFSGWKISMIYLFQVIILGIASFLISLIGVGAFLIILDNHFTALSAVNLSIIKMSIGGIGITLAIALTIPILSVIIPLINLSRKNPVDVIKTI